MNTNHEIINFQGRPGTQDPRMARPETRRPSTGPGFRPRVGIRGRLEPPVGTESLGCSFKFIAARGR